jgi:hypothetical protein
VLSTLLQQRGYIFGELPTTCTAKENRNVSLNIAEIACKIIKSSRLRLFLAFRHTIIRLIEF